MTHAGQEVVGVQVLVYSGTAGFRHDVIPVGNATLEELGRENGFEVTVTEDAEVFSDVDLAPFDVVVFANTSGNVLSGAQRQAMERFIRSGRGFVGIHAAADTGLDWPWYGKLVGAYFHGHPDIQPAEVQVVNRSHPSTQHLPERYALVEEWYSFREVQPGLDWLLTLDESSYQLDEPLRMGRDHPLAWCQRYDGGRSWYTGLGHRLETFRTPEFQHHVLGGLRWAAGLQGRGEQRTATSV